MYQPSLACVHVTVVLEFLVRVIIGRVCLPNAVPVYMVYLYQVFVCDRHGFRDAKRMVSDGTVQ